MPIPRLVAPSVRLLAEHLAAISDADDPTEPIVVDDGEVVADLGISGRSLLRGFALLAELGAITFTHRSHAGGAVRTVTLNVDSWLWAALEIDVSPMPERPVQRKLPAQMGFEIVRCQRHSPCTGCAGYGWNGCQAEAK